MSQDLVTTRKKKKPGIPTGHAGEYFVMGELLRRGYDAQLADRNTRGYDILFGKPDDKELRKIQVKSVRSPPWYVKPSDFNDDSPTDITIYVLIGPEDASKPVRYFIAKNADLKAHVERPANWTEWVDTGFMKLKYLPDFENKWERLCNQSDKDSS